LCVFLRKEILLLFWLQSFAAVAPDSIIAEGKFLTTKAKVLRKAFEAVFGAHIMTEKTKCSGRCKFFFITLILIIFSFGYRVSKKSINFVRDK